MTFTPGWERWFLVGIVLLEAAAGAAYIARGNVRLGFMWLFYACAAALIAPWRAP